MAEYIDRSAVIHEFKTIGNIFVYGRELCEAIISTIDSIPAADVRPVVRGKWVDETIKGVRYHCSVCQGRFDYTWRYCPNCGARMEES